MVQWRCCSWHALTPDRGVVCVVSGGLDDFDQAPSAGLDQFVLDGVRQMVVLLGAVYVPAKDAQGRQAIGTGQACKPSWPKHRRAVAPGVSRLDQFPLSCLVDNLIRRHGRTVQNRPGVAVSWADVPG